jgi:hypothetical protein
MANNELPKAQWGAIVKMAKGAYQGMKTGYKGYKAASLAEKAAKLKKAQTLARTQKAAATRAANAKAAAKKPGTTKTGTTKTSTTSTTKTKAPATPKGKDPFVKSKARLATENVTGKVIGGFPFYTANAIKKTLKNPVAQGILGTGTTLYVANRYAKTNAPKKVKKYKKK